MRKILVAWPFHYQIPVAWFYNWVHMDKSSCVGSVSVEGVQLTHSLNQLVDMALTRFDDWDRLVIMEHDMLPPVDGFTRMASYDDKADIVGSFYFRHEPPHHPYVYLPIDSDTHVGVLSSGDVQRMVDGEPSLFECAAVGFGFTGIARYVLEKWDPAIPMFDFGEPWGSQDLWFCAKAREQGFKVYVDSGLRCGHLTTAPVGYADNQRCSSEGGVLDAMTLEIR